MMNVNVYSHNILIAFSKFDAKNSLELNLPTSQAIRLYGLRDPLG